MAESNIPPVIYPVFNNEQWVEANPIGFVTQAFTEANYLHKNEPDVANAIITFSNGLISNNDAQFNKSIIAGNNSITEEGRIDFLSGNNTNDFSLVNDAGSSFVLEDTNGNETVLMDNLGRMCINEKINRGYDCDINGSLNANSIFLNGVPVSGGAGSTGWTSNGVTTSTNEYVVVGSSGNDRSITVYGDVMANNFSGDATFSTATIGALTVTTSTANFQNGASVAGALSIISGGASIEGDVTLLNNSKLELVGATSEIKLTGSTPTQTIITGDSITAEQLNSESIQTDNITVSNSITTQTINSFDASLIDLYTTGNINAVNIISSGDISNTANVYLNNGEIETLTVIQSAGIANLTGTNASIDNLTAVNKLHTDIIELKTGSVAPAILFNDSVDLQTNNISANESTTTTVNTDVLQKKSVGVTGITVNSNLEMGSSELQFSGSGTGTIKNLSIIEGANNSEIRIQAKGSADIALFTHSASNSDIERLTIKGGVNNTFIGINKPSPSVALDVVGDITNTGTITTGVVMASNQVEADVLQATSAVDTPVVRAVEIDQNLNLQTSLGSGSVIINTNGVERGRFNASGLTQTAGGQTYTTAVNASGYRVTSSSGNNYLNITPTGRAQIYAPSTSSDGPTLQLVNELTGTNNTDGAFISIVPNASTTDLYIENNETSGNIKLITNGNNEAMNINGYSVTLPNASSKLGITTNTINSASKIDCGTATDQDRTLNLGQTGASTYQFYGIAVNNTSSNMKINVPSSAHFLTINNGFGGTSQQEKFRFRPTAEPSILFSSSTSNTGQIGLGALTSSSATNDFNICSSTSGALRLTTGTGANTGINILNSRQIAVNKATIASTNFNEAQFIITPKPNYLGLISINSGSVSGAGTLFTQLFSIGDTVLASGTTYTITGISNDTSMTVTPTTPNVVAVSYTSPSIEARGVFTDGRGYLNIGNSSFPQDPEVPKNSRCYINARDGYEYGVSITSKGVSGGQSATANTIASYINNNSTVKCQLGSYTASNIGLYSGNGSATAYLRHSDQAFVCQSLVQTSDERIKKNIQDLDDGESLNIIRRIKPKKYEYKDPNRNPSMVYGFIAQQVEEVLPYSVQNNKNYIPDYCEYVELIEENGEFKFILPVSYDSINVNDEITLRAQGGDIENIKVLNVSNDKRTLTVEGFDCDMYKAPYFLLGRFVEDFKTLTKDAIFSVGISAIQELDKQINAIKSGVVPSSSSSSNRYYKKLNIGSLNLTSSASLVHSFTLTPPYRGARALIDIRFSHCSPNGNFTGSYTIQRQTIGEASLNLATGTTSALTTGTTSTNILNSLCCFTLTLPNFPTSQSILIEDETLNTDKATTYSLYGITSISALIHFGNMIINVEWH